MRPFPGRRRGLLVLAALAGVTCTDAPTAPHAPDPATLPRQAQLALAPAFTRQAVQAYGALRSFGLSITNVRVTLQRPGGGVVLDTVVQVAAGQTEISLQLTVPVQGNQVDFDAVIQLRDGNQVLFQGTQRVTAQVGAGTGGNPPPPPPVPIDYVGPGASARSVRIVPHDTAVATGASIGFTAQALDASGQPVTNAVVRWSLPDSALGSIGAEDGAFRAGERRGTARVVAELPNGVRDQAQVRVVPPPSQLLLVSGGGQSGTVGHPLAAPVVVEVRATDGVPVAGESVAFTASAGASVSAASVTTDSSGRAATTLTLGRTPGSYSVTATTGRLTPLSATATAAAGAPARASAQDGSGQMGRVGAAAPAPLTVRVADEFDNPVSGVVVTWAVTAGTGRVAQSTSTTGSDGTSAVGYSFGTRPGAESVVATVTTAAGPVTVAFALTAQVGLPETLRILGGASQVVSPGARLAPFSVGVFDAFGNAVPGTAIAWTVAAGEAALSAAHSVTDAAGQAASIATAGNAAGTFTVTAAIPTSQGLPPGPSVEFRATVQAGAAATLAAVSGGGQSGVVGSTAAQPLVVRVSDSFGNAVSGATIRWSATSGSVSPAAATSDAGGGAQATYTFGSGAGSATVTAAIDGASGTTGTVQFTMTALAGAPAAIERAAGDAQVATPGTTLPVSPRVRVADAQGNPVAGAAVTFSVGSGGGSVTEPTRTTNAGGFASVGSWRLGSTAGSNTLIATTGALTTTFTATARTAVAAHMTLVGDSALRITAGNTLPPVGGTTSPVTPQVRVTDAEGKPVAGVTLHVELESPASATPTESNVVSDAQGLAPIFPPAFAPDRAGKWEAMVTSAEIPGAELEVELVVVPASAAAMTRVAGDAQSGSPGSPVATRPAVKVTDAFGNAVPALSVTFFVAVGGGTVTDSAATTDSSGVATVGSWTLGRSGAQSLTAKAGALSATFSATLPAPTVTKLVVVHGRVTGHPGDRLLLAVRAVDERADPDTAVSGVLVNWSVLEGSFQFDSASNTSTTDSDGVAWMTITPTTTPGRLAAFERASLAEEGSRHAMRATVASNSSISAELRALVLPRGVTKGWFGNGAGDWDDTSNWNGGIPPGLTDKVFIPGWAPGNQPKLSGRRGVLDLLIENAADAGVDLNGNELEVRGNLEAHGAGVFGTGGSRVLLTGGAKTLRGKLAVPAVSITSDVSLDGSTTFGGAVAVDSVGRLRVGSHQADVTGDLSVTGNDAFLEMSNASGTLRVSGNLTAGGGNHAGKLTAGTLELGGNLTESGGANEAFQASEGLVVRLTGPDTQTVSFAHGESSHLNHLEVEKAQGAVRFVGDQHFTGDLRVLTPTALTVVGEAMVEVQGRVRTVSRSSLAGISNLRLVGTDSFPAIDGTPPGRLTIMGTRTLGNHTTINTWIDVQGGGMLRLNGRTLTVTGDVTLGGDGALQSVDAGSTLHVNGNLTAGGGHSTLTAGAIELTGNFTEQGTAADAFVPTGSHTVRLLGSANQAVSFAHPNDSRFQNLEIDNAGGAVTFTGAQHVAGALEVTKGTLVQSGDTVFEVSGSVRTDAGTSLAGIPRLTTRGAFATFPRVDGTPPPVLAIGNDFSLDGDATWNSDMKVVTGGKLRLARKSLTVGGNFSLTGDAYLLMQDSASTLKVAGNLLAGGGDHAGALTAGTLEIGGDFTEADGNAQAFQADSIHLTRLTGTRTHSIRFAHDQSSWFNDLEIIAGADATFTSDAKVGRNMDNSGKFSVEAGKELTVGGTLKLNEGSNANAGEDHGQVNVRTGGCTKNPNAKVNNSTSKTIQGCISG